VWHPQLTEEFGYEDERAAPLPPDDSDEEAGAAAELAGLAQAWAS